MNTPLDEVRYSLSEEARSMTPSGAAPLKKGTAISESDSGKTLENRRSFSGASM